MADLKKAGSRSSKKINSPVKQLSENDLILESFRPLVKSIGKAFGPNCEVALYSLSGSSGSCIEIENGDISGKKTGSPMSAFVKDILRDADSLDEDTTEVYYTKTKDGRSLKSVTTVIRNFNGEVIGCLCIDIDVSVPLHEFIMNFLPVVDSGLSDALSEHFPSDVDQLIEKTLEVVIADVNTYRKISGSERNKLIVKELNKRGIFSIRGAVDIIADQLGVSRYTIYNYIKEAEAEASKF